MIQTIKTILTTTMVARLLGCTESTVRRLIKSNQLSAIKLEGSNKCLVKRDDVLRYAESKEKKLLAVKKQVA